MTHDELCAWLRTNSAGIYRPAAEAAGVIESLRRELEKWQTPFDREQFEAAQMQYTQSHDKSLLAQAIYIVALEHAIKHRDLDMERLTKERDGYKEDAERVREQRDRMVAKAQAKRAGLPEELVGIADRMRNKGHDPKCPSYAIGNDPRCTCCKGFAERILEWDKQQKGEKK
jgi:hypothetical protein